MRYEIRLAGEGGQGLVLAGVILAEAVAASGSKNVAQSQAYGPEARGGASSSEVVISDEEIDYPRVVEADLLLAMSQEAYDRSRSELKKDGILIVDSVLVDQVVQSSAYRVPITQIAEEATGSVLTANMVALGLVVGLTDLVPQKAVEAALCARVPASLREMNAKALQAGIEWARSCRE